MKNEIRTVTTTKIDSYGHTLRTTGLWNNQLFDITLYCEYDGRDVDSETPNGGYNPMQDDTGNIFFDKLCEDKRFIKLHQDGYAVYEKIPHSDWN